MGCVSVPLRQLPPSGAVKQRLWQVLQRQQTNRRQLRARLHIRLAGVAGWGQQQEWEVLVQQGGRLVLARRSVLTQPDLLVTSDGMRACVLDLGGRSCHSLPTPNRSERQARNSPFCRNGAQGCDDNKAGSHAPMSSSSRKIQAKQRNISPQGLQPLPLEMSLPEISAALLGLLPLFNADALSDSSSANGCDVKTMTTDRHEQVVYLQLSCPQGDRAAAHVRLHDGALLYYERFDPTGRWRYRVRYEEIQQQGNLPLAHRMQLWSRWQGKRVRLIVRFRQAVLNGPLAPDFAFEPPR